MAENTSENLKTLKSSTYGSVVYRKICTIDFANVSSIDFWLDYHPRTWFGAANIIGSAGWGPLDIWVPLEIDNRYWEDPAGKLKTGELPIAVKSDRAREWLNVMRQKQAIRLNDAAYQATDLLLNPF